MNGSVLGFFVLAFALAVPFWLIGAVTGLELLPGLPVASLATVCPVIAAVILVYRENNGAGVMALLRLRGCWQSALAAVWSHVRRHEAKDA